MRPVTESVTEPLAAFQGFLTRADRFHEVKNRYYDKKVNLPRTLKPETGRELEKALGNAFFKIFLHYSTARE